ncbi:superinfection immunity protein [Streptomyces sp. NBC_00654]|uniref:superinfection immunity protein n=1 Tax=Streptomyces sp. NBC_00654 TaxID=2975799 RepID=UPI002255D44D|nr:superinfection immunity protein [Streptomyces sp. NBC_00654]MCX4970410.1 superinfection immunity protein [Streptomyces sp. NBC_00654]
MDIVVTLVLGVLGAAVYLLPSLIAFNRRTENRWLVLVINVLFGATFLGWVLALFLALRKAKVPTTA